MDAGVLLERGAQPWQIFQQGEAGTADITLAGRYTLCRLQPPPPFTHAPQPAAAPRVQVRIVRESSGEPVVAWADAALLPGQRWQLCLPCVPAGGLYRIETRLALAEADGYTFIRGDMVHCVGVGDIFVVAGQSNACGRSTIPVEDGPELGVHLLRPSGRWDLASHPLNEATGAVYTGNAENHNPGHSAFLWLAKRLRRAAGHPIGLVMAAHGGTPLSWWNPQENGALLHNMAEMLCACGVRPRAMLWYQGEAEGYEAGAATYLKRFEGFVCAARQSLGQPGLPIFTVQLNRCLADCSEALDHAWGRVRQAQAQAAEQLENVYVVPANDLPLYDAAHLSPEGNLRLGERLCDAMRAVLYGHKTAWQAPRLAEARRMNDHTLRLRFAPVLNGLEASGLPGPLLPIEAQDREGLVAVQEYSLQGDTLLLHLARPLGRDAVVHGMWRENPGPAVLQDAGRIPVLSFYNVAIKE